MAGPSARQVDRAILDLLADRAPTATICPSEAARVLADGGDFRPLMDRVRERAAVLADSGELVVTQRGRRVDARSASGPIRLGRPR